MPKLKRLKKGFWEAKSTLFLLVLLAVVAAAIGVLSAAQEETKVRNQPNNIEQQIGFVPNFDHIVTIVEENQGNEAIIGNPRASFINYLAKNYSLATNYWAITRPSLPNYLYMTSATNDGIVTNCDPSYECRAKVPNIADRIEKSGRSWKAYMESMPAPCHTESVALYNTQHNPFLYYANIVGNPKRCLAHDVPLSELDKDLASADTLPNYVFISPNLCNDMHDCNIEVGDQWLAQLSAKILGSPAFVKQNSLLIITWDEAEDESTTNKVPLILVGPSVRNHYTSNKGYDHLALIRTIEQAWGFQPFNNSDKKARVMSEFFVDSKR